MYKLWPSCFAVAVILFLFGSLPAQAQATDASDYMVWRANFGIAATESAELIIDNSGCADAATVTVGTTDSQGLVTHEVVHVAQNSGAVYPVPLPAAAADRSALGIEVWVKPGPCVRVMDAALAVIGDNRSTAVIRHTPEWSTFNDHDPGGSATAEGQNNFIHLPPTRIGPGQSAEFAFWNNCPAAVSAELRLRNIGTGAEEVLTADLEPSEFKQLALAVLNHETAVHLVGFGTFVVKDRQSDLDPCPRGLGLFTGTLSLTDEAGNTTSASGLPTGKRQHKPVN